MGFKPIPLTASQIKHFDEIEFDKKAVKETFEVAMNYHANRVNELTKTNNQLWKELADAHGLDLYRQHYRLSQVDGVLSIVQVEED